jgi:general secretion pathway protein D
MRPDSSSFFRFVPAALSACALLWACAADPVKDARQRFSGGRAEEALAELDRASRENPSNYALRSEYFRLRELLMAQWLGQADTMRLAGEYDVAEGLYRKVLTYDGANARANTGLAQVVADRRHRLIVAAAEKLVKDDKYREAQDVLRPVLAENPQHREALRLQRRIDERLMAPAVATVQLKTTATKPLSLELRDVTVRSAFDVLSRASGVTFVFDKDVRADQRTTIVVRDATVEEAIRMILLTNQLEQKILNDRTVLVFPNTPQKLREYQELVVRSFYLANADVRQTANMIRTLVKTRDIFIDEKLNLLVIKDTPNAIRLAERLIAAQDVAEPEVMLEIEILEVGSNKLVELGVRFPDTVFFQDPNTVGAAGGGTGTALGLQRATGPLTGFVATPVLVLKLHQDDGTTNVLANPRIRVKNKEKARVHIGDRVPVITTTAAATGGFVSESVSYLDVGLKLEVEPLIYIEDEVGIKVGLEVSNIVKEVRGTTTGSLAYQIGTRNANTTLRLKDGETQILAGLIQDEDRRTATRIPGLGDLPVLGRLFSQTSDTTRKTELVLLITPRLVRTVARPGVYSIEFAAGTEASTGSPVGAPITPVQPPVLSPVPPKKPAAPQPTPGATPLTPPGSPPAPVPGAGAVAPPPGPGASPAQPPFLTQPQTPLPAPDMVPFGGVQPEPKP